MTAGRCVACAEGRAPCAREAAHYAEMLAAKAVELAAC
jgi:hypothetical protein